MCIISNRRMRLVSKVALIACIAVLWCVFSNFQMKVNTRTSLSNIEYCTSRPELVADKRTVNSSSTTALPTRAALSNTTTESDSNLFKKRLPKCLIIGFSKCGTYVLKAFLSLHPDVVAADHEVAYFTSYYDNGVAWYLEQMPSSLESQITVEKTPNYILSTRAHQRIQAFNSSIKLIIAVRDPVTRIQSLYAHTKAMQGDSFRSSFEQFALGNIPNQVDYASPIEKLYESFPRDQVLVVNEELLEEEPLSVMKKLESFLGLRPAFTDDLLVFNPTKGFYCFNITHPRYQEIGEVSLINHKTGCFHRNKGRPHHNISSSLLKQLVLGVKPYNERLFSLLGKRFNWIDESDIQMERLNA